jgi:hypothetical protein
MHIYKLLFIRCNGNNRGRKSRSGYMQVHLQEVQELNAGIVGRYLRFCPSDGRNHQKRRLEKRVNGFYCFLLYNICFT